MQRAVGQECADFRQPRSDVVGKRTVASPRDEYDRPNRAQKQFGLGFLNVCVAPHDVQPVFATERKHHGEWFVGPVFS